MTDVCVSLCIFLKCIFKCIFVAVFSVYLLYLRFFRVSPVCILRLELQEKLAVSLDTAACTVSWCRHWGSKRARAQERKRASKQDVKSKVNIG